MNMMESLLDSRATTTKTFTAGFDIPLPPSSCEICGVESRTSQSFWHFCARSVIYRLDITLTSIHASKANIDSLWQLLVVDIKRSQNQKLFAKLKPNIISFISTKSYPD